MHELIAYITAQLDAEEQVAQDVKEDGPGIWAVADDPHGTYMEVLGALRPDAKPGDGYWHGGLVSWVLDDMTDHRGYPCDPDEIRPGYLALATHIARHDPASTLRDVAAKRRMLARAVAGKTCGQAHPQADIDCLHPHPDEEVLLDLVQRYAGSDGFKEEWRA